MSNVDNAKFAKLQHTFPKLTEANQQYVFGLAERLVQAQKCNGEALLAETLDSVKDTDSVFCSCLLGQETSS